MSEDLSDVLNNFKGMINSGNIPDNLKEILGNLNTNNSNSNNILSKTSNNSKNISNPNNSTHNAQINHSETFATSDNNFNIDFDTILKMKAIIDSINKKDDPRANLLYSLKPYLRESRKKQLDQYVNLLNMSKIADIMKNDKKENNSNAGG